VARKAELEVFGNLSGKEEMNKMPCMVFIARDVPKEV